MTYVKSEDFPGFSYETRDYSDNTDDHVKCWAVSGMGTDVLFSRHELEQMTEAELEYIKSCNARPEWVIDPGRVINFLSSWAREVVAHG